MRKLIVDAGSTKTEWILLDGEQVLDRFSFGGYNPNYNEAGVLLDLLYRDLPETFPAVEAVYWYGSGCGSEKNRSAVAQFLRVRFEEASEVVVTHDLMAVCHAVLGNEPGIACILGTGANSCLYDGKEVVGQAVSLGYLVGDEGSGCYLGRKVVRAYFYDLMPGELKFSFEQTYHLEIKDFIDKVYHEPGASRYLARFAKFAGDHQQHPYMRQLVKGCFEEFVQVFVLRYPEARSLPICFVGSVAYHFQELLQECLEAEGLTMGKVRQTPAEGLIRYHQVR
ncbi:MAG: ATPase [Bacteroidales bacterium]|nr:ATPase [Bacteroidales bacterium]